MPDSSAINFITTDPNLPVDDEWAKTVCRIGQAGQCCRYLAIGGNGWSCEKSNPDMALHLDMRVASQTINARGDNCTGRACK